MKTLVITEGKLDQILLQHLLASDPPSATFEVVSAGAASSAISLARSYLATGDDQVALVLDAETIDPDQIPQKHEAIVDLLESIASRQRFLVLLTIPATEGLLFLDRAKAESLFNKRLTDEEWAEAKYQPKIALGRMIQGKPTGIINLSKFERLLENHDLKPFTSATPVQNLRQFIADSTKLICGAETSRL